MDKHLNVTQFQQQFFFKFFCYVGYFWFIRLEIS